MQSFAESVISYSDGQTNASQPPDATIASGFIPEQSSARGQPLPAGWLNWLLRTLFRYANRDKVTDTNGLGLFPYPNCAIRIDAIDMNDTTKWLTGIGFKGASGVHSLHVTGSATLTLGTPTLNGDQPIVGGANVRIVGYNRQLGDL
jgi:hypothetical protein